MLIDTHCHLGPKYLPNGPDEVLARAREAGVVGFVCVGVGKDLAPAKDAIELAKRRDDVVAAIGFHPHEAKLMTDEVFSELSELVRDPQVVAVGETGLDYHYDHSPRPVQAEAFRKQIALAREVQKPIVVHTREAPEDTLAILEEENARDVGGIIHCFSEDWAFATRALDLGFDLSFSGIVTFPNAPSVREVAQKAPLDRILVETDSPYLAPVPMRGKKCEPAYVVHTARCIAELRGIPFEELAQATTENARRRLGIRV